MDKSQADARQCLEQQVRASEAELSIAEINQRQQIELLGEDVKVRKQMIAAFNASSSQYKNYRKKQCEFQAVLAAGGSGSSHRRLLCILELNSQRIAHLVGNK